MWTERLSIVLECLIMAKFDHTQIVKKQIMLWKNRTYQPAFLHSIIALEIETVLQHFRPVNLNTLDWVVVSYYQGLSSGPEFDQILK